MALIERLTTAQEDASLKEINYTREQLSDDIQALRKWLNDQHHLPAARLKESDSFLRNFLMGCKGSLEKCKKKIDSYYTFKSSESPIFKDFDPMREEMEKTKKCLRLGSLPKHTDDGSIVHFMQMDHNFCDVLPLFKMLAMLCEVELRLEGIEPQQIIMVVDQKNSKFDVKQNPLILRDFLYFSREATPFRLKMLLYVNVQPMYVTFVNLVVKPLLSKKIAERIQFFTGGWEELTDILPNHLLPKDFGGQSPSTQEIADQFYKSLADKRNWFKNDLIQKTDENKRPTNGFKCDHPYFGAEGSFKALRID